MQVRSATLNWLLLLPVLTGVAVCRGRQLRFNSSRIELITYTTPGAILLTGLPFTAPAFEIASEEIAHEYGLNLTNTLLTRNTQGLVTCDDMAANSNLLSQYIYQHWDDGRQFIILNPGCDDEIPLAFLSKEWNLALLTSGTVYPVFYEPATFPTTTNFGVVDYRQLTQFLFDVFEQYSWTSVVVVHDVSPAYSVYSTITKTLSGYPAKVAGYLFLPIDTRSTVTYESILMQIRPVSRVVLLLMVATPARKFMVAAQKMGIVNGEYVFLCAEPFEGIRRFGNLTWQAGDEDDPIARVAFRSVLQVTGLGSCFETPNDAEQAVAVRIKKDGIRDYDAPYLANEDASALALSSYYSLKALGQVLYETITEQADLSDGRALAARFSNRTFVFSSRKILMSPGRIRVIDYCLRDMDSDSGKMKVVFSYEGLTRKLVPLENRSIDWGTPGNIAPESTPVRLRDQKAGSWDSILTPIVVTTVLLVAMFLAILLLMWNLRARRMRELREWWLLQPAEVNFPHINEASGQLSHFVVTASVIPLRVANYPPISLPLL